MSTKHVMTGEFIARPSAKSLKRKLKTADSLNDFKMKPGYLYTVVRAISARVNQNYDGWPSDELQKAAHTFVGKPCFVNHENYDPKKARGVIVAARYVDAGRDKYVEVIQEIDAKRFPKLAHEIRTGGLDSVSMGAEAGFTICSYCGNKAYDVPDMCEHVLFHKGEKLSRFNRKTGRREDVLVYESCHKLSFFELSYVFDPADETAVASKVVMAASGVGNSPGYAQPTKWNRSPRNKSLNDTKRRWRAEPEIGDSPDTDLVDVDPFDPRSYQARVLEAYRTAADCPPGKDCTIHDPDEKPLSGMAGFGNPNNTAESGGSAAVPAASGAGTPIGGGDLGKTPAAGGTPVSTSGGVPLIKNPDGSYTSSDPAWAHLIDRESGGQNIKQSPSTQDVNSGGNEAYGLFQITPGTWSSHGGQGSVYDSTPEQQAQVAADIIRKNPSGSDWGAGMEGREDASALSSGLSQPTQETQMAHPKAASFEDRVLRVAGFKGAASSPFTDSSGKYQGPMKSNTSYPPSPYGGSDTCPECGQHFTQGHAPGCSKASKWGKVADKCHYCAGDAEEGFSSCSGHRKMEENKFTKKVLEAAGFKQADKTDDYLEWSRKVDAGEEVPEKGPVSALPTQGLHDWAGRAKKRQSNHPGASQGWSYDQSSDTYNHPSGHVLKPSTDKPGTHQLWAPTVTMRPPHGLAMDKQPHADLQKHFDWVDKTGAFEAQVINAFRKGAPFADYEDFADCESKNQDKGDTGAYCGEIKHRTEDKKEAMSFESRVLEAAGMHRMPDHPGRHEAPPGRDPHVPPEGYQVYDAKDWLNLPQPIEASFTARVLHAWGETEAPAAVDTLREEGSAPEDDSNDFYEYVKPPKELQTPDTSQAAQIDREQDEMGMDTDGMPGPASPDAGLGGPPQPQQQFMELKIPIPQPGQAGATGAPSIPMQPYQEQPPAPAPPPGQPPQQIAASTLAYFDRYFGHRVGREMNLQTLENGHAGFTKSRNPMKGTANMARSTLASRGKVVTAGRRQHFAEGPLVDTGDQSRNDQGEQEEVFITQTPPAEPVDAPTDDTPNISNTENNLVAKVRRGRDQLLRDAQALATYRQKGGKRRTAGDQDEAGGPVATEVDPTVNTGPAGEELTGDDFESADPNADVVETQPKDASLHAFKQFDRWLASKTGRPSRQHTSATIRRAADDYSRAVGISVQAMFPALGIVLREARKNEKPNTKGAKNMRKRAVDLEVAAPDGRIDVEAPTEDTTDAEAQASQFDLNDFGNNAGDNIADPDLSTDQNWAPGEANKTSKVKTAGGILAFRCAEAMIAAGLEPNTVERKYALAGAFENMNRGLIQSQTSLCERFAAVLQNERRKVASGSTRGAALQPPVPRNLTQRTAGTVRVAANDPRNDSTMFV